MQLMVFIIGANIANVHNILAEYSWLISPLFVDLFLCMHSCHRGITRLNDRARQDVAIIGSEFLKTLWQTTSMRIAMYRWQSISNLKTALPMIPDFKELS